MGVQLLADCAVKKQNKNEPKFILLENYGYPVVLYDTIQNSQSIKINDTCRYGTGNMNPLVSGMIRVAIVSKKCFGTYLRTITHTYVTMFQIKNCVNLVSNLYGTVPYYTGYYCIQKHKKKNDTFSKPL